MQKYHHTTTKNTQILAWALGVMLLLIMGILIITRSRGGSAEGFNGDRALADVQFQTSLGPRIPGTEGHEKLIAWIVDRIENSDWGVEIHDTTINNIRIRNIIAKNSAEPPDIILGAHYDTRMYADRDPDPQKWVEPVPGANDGASGVAVLLELARTIPRNLDENVWLVFFDVEDNGNIPGWDWILGSQAFVRDYDVKPEAVVIVDMIGDKDLNIHYEVNSDIELSREIWEIAESLGFINNFIPTPNRSILDDHMPFLQAGIRAIDIIDFDYVYWHTTQDTADKVSAQSLQIVGDVLTTWLLQK